MLLKGSDNYRKLLKNMYFNKPLRIYIDNNQNFFKNKNKLI